MLFILAIVTGWTQTHAQAPPEVSYLSSGPWTGVAQASGVATTFTLGIDFLYDGVVKANLKIVAENEASVGGQWTHYGSANNLITGNVSGQQATIDADLLFSGSGTIGGSPEILLLDGSSRSTGSATVSASQGSFTNPVDNESVVPNLQVKIQHAQCDEAYGDWVWALEQEFENQGFRAELEGRLWQFAMRPRCRIS